MNQKEISNTYALVGGTAAWKNAGYPMESSTTTPPVAAQPVIEQPVVEQNKANANSLKK
ncbi:MAG: hypothetical protein IPL32_10415 [Chloracidobacterium sp.]|nr:hypothetical protein [Chloracidobacterium sp.]